MYIVCMFVGAEALDQASFGEGTGRIWLANVQCTENETSLLQCSVASSGVNSCTHAGDAGVRCSQGTVKALYCEKCDGNEF